METNTSCLNCGKEITQKPGARKRIYCDNQNSCKQAYHNKNKKEKKYVLKTTYDRVCAELIELKIKWNNLPENKEKILSERNTVVRRETQKLSKITNYENKKEMPSGLSRIDAMRWLRENT